MQRPNVPNVETLGYSHLSLRGQLRQVVVPNTSTKGQSQSIRKPTFTSSAIDRFRRVAQNAGNVVAFPHMARFVSSFLFFLMLVGQRSLLAQLPVARLYTV